MNINRKIVFFIAIDIKKLTSIYIDEKSREIVA